MKKLLNGTILLLLMCAVLGLASCMNDGGSDWVGKWQLREYQYPDGEVQKVDSIFYGFQKEFPTLLHIFIIGKCNNTLKTISVIGSATPL